MNGEPTSWWPALLIGMAVWSSSIPASDSVVGKHGTVVLELSAHGHKTNYSFRGHDYSFSEFYKAAGEEFKNDLDENDPYFVLVEDEVPLSSVYDVIGTLRAMPYRNIREFVFSKGSDVMQEIQFLRAYPFVRDPTPELLSKPIR